MPILRFLLLLLIVPFCISAQTFRFPTANRTLLQDGGGERFFVGTTGRPWTSGMFGCVRSEGFQMHEGIDIRCQERDNRGEPIDAVVAAAPGVVVYVNDKQALSNYGKYVILRHQIEGIDVYTTYAHLREIKCGEGDRVDAGEQIGVMGRTANTREGISKERAHLHFEINLYVNDRFPAWYKSNFPGQRNDHGQWNGQNMLGLDPRLILLAQAEEGAKFSLLRFIRTQTELCRIIVRDTSFPWVKRYAPLVRRNAIAEREGVVAYEIAMNYNGVPFELIPRAQSEIQSASKVQVISVNESEFQKCKCRKIVVKRSGRWELAATGQRLVNLLTY